MTKSRFFMLSLAVLLTAVPNFAGDREFHEVVNRMADACHKRPMRMMGLVTFVARPFMPSGVSGLKLAIFDDVSPTALDSQDLDVLMRNIAGPGYEPFVRVQSRRDHEQTYIYLREVKGASELLILNVDHGDTVVIKVRLKPEAMKDWMDDPVGQGRSHGHGGVGADWND